jgi:hypothetical protein|tara:strand:- start:284 stop:454 length:171 start_codon:yes stop_codon:yes gene_type:complete
MSMLTMLKEGRYIDIDSKSDIEPSYEIVDDQIKANGGFGIASFGITPFAKEQDRAA